MPRIGPLSVGTRTYRVTCLALTVASVGVGGTGVYLASQWNRTTEVALTDVLRDFRRGAEAVTDPVDVPAAPTPAVAGPGAPADTIPAATAPPDDGGTAAPAPDPGAAVPAPVEPGPAPTPGEPAPQGPVPFGRPAEGVYRYAASGHEVISVGGARHDYPGQVNATVTHTACGFRIRIHVIEEHIDTVDFCVDGARLGFHRSHQRITFLGNTAEGSLACDPWMVTVDRSAGPGALESRPCTAGSLSADVATTTYVGDETVTVDGAEVHGSRATWAWQSTTGDSTGSGEQSWVFDADGLPLVIERSGTTTAPSILGRTTHTERARFVLLSRTPLR